MLLSKMFVEFASLLLMFVLPAIAKDYYKLLGVEKNAKEADIKRAFRKLAMKYHPDRNKSPDAEKQFREIAEAYEVLSDSKKRRQYDQTGSYQEHGGGGGTHHFHDDFNFDKFFRDFDESFKAHKEGFQFHGSFFNFDNLWDDDEGEGDSFFKQFKMPNFGFGGSFFGGDGSVDEPSDGEFDPHDLHQRQHQFVHRNTHAWQHLKATHGGGGPSSSQRTCKTVTQRVGNSVTTYTECT